MSIETQAKSPSTAPSGLAEAAEDHALVSVPEAERKSGWSLSISTVGVVTALVIFAIAGYSVILAGFWYGVIAGLVVGIIGFVLSNLLGRMARSTGLSSTITSRYFGFGLRGSALGAVIFAFMILGFLALESSLLYQGTLLMLGISSSWASTIIIYAILTLMWIALAIFGLKVVLRAATVLTIVTIAVAIFVIVRNFTDGGATVASVFDSQGVVPGGWWAKTEAAISLGGATAGTISLVTTDIARYARGKRDVTVLAAAGPVVQNVLMTVIGALVVVGGMPTMINYLVAHESGLSPAAAGAAAGGFAMGNTGAFFVVVAGWLGCVTIYASQAKAQAMNAYSGSLALCNLVNALTGRKPPRALMVVVGNAIALIMISANILGSFSSWLAYLGSMTLALCGVMIADYYIVRRRRFDAASHRIENWNWAGIITLVVSATLGIFLVAANILSIGFLVSLAVSLIGYPVLRALLPEGTGTGFADEAAALDEAV